MRVLEECHLRNVNAEIGVSNRRRAVTKNYQRLLKCAQFCAQMQYLKYLEYFEYFLANHGYIMSTARLMSLLLRSGWRRVEKQSNHQNFFPAYTSLRRCRHEVAQLSAVFLRLLAYLALHSSCLSISSPGLGVLWKVLYSEVNTFLLQLEIAITSTQ